MFILCSIQSTFYSSAREFVLGGGVGIVYRDFILVIKTSFTRIAFLLFKILNSISRTECFKLSSQLPKGYLNKVLIIRASNINFLFDAWVITNYQLPYLMKDAVINYYSRCFVQIVTNAVVTPLIKTSLFVCKRFNSLLIFLGLQLSIALVVPLVNAFKSFSINQKLMSQSRTFPTNIVLRDNNCFERSLQLFLR